MPYFNYKNNKNKRKAKLDGKPQSILYNSYYANLFLIINFESPREIKNEDGVIIIRHFRSLFVNAREYPKTRIKSFSVKNKFSSNRKINFKKEEIKYKTYNGNFFSIEVILNSKAKIK